MDYEAHCDAVRSETGALVDAFGRGDMGATVPTCPEWTVRDLAAHVGEFTGLWTHILCEGTGRQKTPYEEIPGDDAAVADWYEGLAASLLGELAATPAGTAVWTWVPDDQTARFAARRCANELAFHRFDAQSSAGGPDPLDAAVAADAIEEVFVMVPAWGNQPDASGKILGLRATDQPYERTIAMTTRGLEVEPTGGDADLILTGTASDLALLLFGRPPLGTVERAGDPATLDAWYREFHFG